MKKIIITALLGVIALLVVPGCYKVATVTLENTSVDTAKVSFGNEIIPVFEKNCALSGCHVSGGQAPDLSSADVYNSLIAGGFTNTAKPSNSTLYLWLTGKEAVAMPFGATNDPSNINALTLAWITQGAKNN